MSESIIRKPTVEVGGLQLLHNHSNLTPIGRAGQVNLLCDIAWNVHI